ncbi:MAG: hypothetical protein HYX80_06600 [Chloroflexi bacterium]|nr:hypothetical protein [Chloroflexota bacterium]
MAKTKIKRPRITGDVKEAVIALYRQGLGPKEIFKLRGKKPSLRSIQTIVTEAKRIENTPEFQEKERPWHLGLLRDYPHLSAEAIRHILETQEYLRYMYGLLKMSLENSDPEVAKRVNPDVASLRLRQALWAARLYDIVRKQVDADEWFKVEASHDFYPGTLFSVSAAYADYELLCDFANVPCDTSELDTALSRGIRHFNDFVAQHNTQSSKEPLFVGPVEGHKQPHKIEGVYLVFDKACPRCQERAITGSFFNLRAELTRQGVFDRLRAKTTESIAEGGKP